MKLTSTIKQFFPDSILPYFRLINNVILKNGACLKKIPLIKENNTLVVLGNGPSLDQDVDTLRALEPNSDFFCVNNFACSSLFSELKPSKYIFMDDYFFSDKAHFDWIEQRNKTFKSISEKTTWKLKIFVPAQADLSILKKGIKNSNIEFIKFSTTGFVSSNLKMSFKLFDTGLFGPFQGNVLIYAIYLGIWAKYNKIFVYGADMSLHENVMVDQQTNNLYMNFKHFGNQLKKELFVKNPEKVEPFRLHEFLELSSATFYAHHVLSEYAKSKNIRIYNKSSYSLIDSYKRSED